MHAMRDRTANRVMRTLLAAPALLLTACATSAPERADPGLVDLATRVPDARYEMRYASDDNFVGAVVDGYAAPRCLLSPPAATALQALQEEIRPFGLSLVLYDCYRPQRAVDHFVRWSRDPGDVKTRDRYYPREDKATLFQRGYIAGRSGHSRGSTVDLGLATGDGKVLDFGTGWDFLDPLSATENPAVGEDARRNRLLLRALMQKHGFRNYDKEWWHYTLEQEPWPDRYFDVPVR